jgi:hypothetical protein
MKMHAILALAAAGLFAVPASAQDGRTASFENDNYSATRTVTHGGGTTTRDTEVTRKSDGATAESSFVRQRTDTGVTRNRSTTHFDGRTSSTSYERWRTPHGWRAEGQHVQRDGDVVGYNARGVFTPRGRVSRQTISFNGERVATRRVKVTHGPRGTHRQVIRRHR